MNIQKYSKLFIQIVWESDCPGNVRYPFHYPTFNSSEVTVLTNKQQMLLKTSTSLRYATPVGNDYIMCIN